MTVNTQSLTNQVTRDFAANRPNANKEKSERNDIPDFQSLIAQSNMDFKAEQAKKEAKMGEGGELRLGETKDDKAFREMLERVTGKKETKAKNKLEKEDFLNLMVTQLKYQDPTKPADHKDMAQQLAQFNSVEQLASANKSLEKIATGQQELKNDKITEYIDKEITVKGSNLQLSGSTLESSPLFKISEDAVTVSIAIKDSQGQLVRNLALGDLKKGEHNFTWDGKDNKGEAAQSGTYTFEVIANTVEGRQLEPTTYTKTVVTGVSDLDKGGVLETPAGEVKLGDIVAIRNQRKEQPNGVPAEPAQSLKNDEVKN